MRSGTPLARLRDRERRAVAPARVEALRERALEIAVEDAKEAADEAAADATEALADAAAAQEDATAAQQKIDDTLAGVESFEALNVDGVDVSPFLGRTDGTSLDDPAAVPTPVIQGQVRSSVSATGPVTYDSGTGEFGLNLTAADVTSALTYTPTSVTGLTGVQSVADFKTGLSLVKADVGLPNVDNTSDANKPVSTATQAALDLKVDLSAVGSASGVASLDAGGKVPNSQLPSIGVTDVYVVGSEVDQVTLIAEEGDVAVRTDLNKSYIHNGGTAGTMADWQELLTPTDAVLSVNGMTGAVAVTTITGNAGTATALSAGADRTKLDGIATGATANDTDANLKARANHTGAEVVSVADGAYAVAGEAPNGNLRFYPRHGTYAGSLIYAFSAGYAGEGPLGFAGSNFSWLVGLSEVASLSSGGVFHCAGGLSTGQTATAAAVAQTHHVPIVIGGVTYKLLLAT